MTNHFIADAGSQTDRWTRSPHKVFFLICNECLYCYRNFGTLCPVTLHIASQILKFFIFVYKWNVISERYLILVITIVQWLSSFREEREWCEVDNPTFPKGSGVGSANQGRLDFLQLGRVLENSAVWLKLYWCIYVCTVRTSCFDTHTYICNVYVVSRSIIDIMIWCVCNYKLFMNRKVTE